MNSVTYINENLTIAYTISLKQHSCAICGRSHTPRRPIDIIDSETKRPACTQCASKYATELYVMVRRYYGTISEAERALITLF